MQIDRTLLDKKNYQNPRLIPLMDKKAIELFKELLKMQKELNPTIEEFNKTEEKMKKLSQTMKDFDQKASVYQQKLIPILEKFLDGKLGEFERYVGIEEKGDGIYLKIHDALEDWVVAYRKNKEVSAEAKKQIEKK